MWVIINQNHYKTPVAADIDRKGINASLTLNLHESNTFGFIGQLNGKANYNALIRNINTFGESFSSPLSRRAAD